MTVTSKLIRYSVSSEGGPPLPSFELRYPRFIHSEVMTHRVMSRNASSSRAIPVKRMIEEILRDPAMPEKWVLNEPGMQGYTEASPAQVESLKAHWLAAMHWAISSAQNMADAGAHKQHINRVLEPWMHIKVVVTATEWANFFELRDHPAAEPTFQVLARQMVSLLDTNTPDRLDRGEWHLPYIDHEDRIAVESEVRAFFRTDHPGYEQSVRGTTRLRLLAISVARCARTSYDSFDGVRSTWDKDRDLFNKLITSKPEHASPTEHQARPDWKVWDVKSVHYGDWQHPQLHGNLAGWQQFRHAKNDSNFHP